MFNKSFSNMKRDLSSGQGIGMSIFGGNSVTKNDVQNIRDFDTAIKNGSTTAQAWQKHMTGCTVAAKQQAKQCLINKGSLSELANGLEQTSIKAKAATVGIKALSIAGNMLMMMGISLAISAVVKAFTHLYNISDKLAEKTKELTDSLNSQVDEYNNLKSDLDEVNKKLKDNESRYSELIEKQKESGLTTEESGELEELQRITGELTNQKNILEENIRLKKESAAATAQELASTLLKQEDVKSFMDGTGGKIKSFFNEIQESLIKMIPGFGKLYSAIDTVISLFNIEIPKDSWLNKIANIFDGTAIISWLTGTDIEEDSYDEAVSKYEDLQKKMKAIRDKYDKNGDGIIDSNSSMSSEDSQNYKKYYDESVEVANSLKTEYQELDDAIKSIEADPNLTQVNKEELERLRAVRDIIADILGYNNKSKTGDGIVSDEDIKNVDKMTASLGDLKNASEGISSLAKAFKEMDDDGYVSIDTISEIKEAVGGSVDNWEEYERVLLTAKKGSAEFNNVLTELTYKMLESKFATVGLENATEEQVAAVLRENGVLNAEKVAHEAVAKAKFANELKTKKLITVTNGVIKVSKEEIAKLKEKALQLGYTERAYIELIVREQVFNNQKLNLSQKIKALKEYQKELGITGTLLDNLTGGSSPIDRVNNAYDLGVRGVDGDVIYNGKNYGHGSEALEAATSDALIDQFNKGLDEKYGTGGSGGTGVGYSGASDGDSKSDKDKPNYEDPTDAVIDRINLPVKNLEQKEKEIKSKLDIAKENGDTEAQISLGNELANIHKSMVSELGTANAAIDNEIQWLQRDNPWDEATWFDSQGNATEAYIALYNEKIKDNEDEAASIKELFDVLSKYKKAYNENADEILSLGGEIASDENAVSDALSELHNKRVSSIENKIAIALSNDPYADVASFYEELQEEYHKEAERLRALNPEKYKEEIQELQQKWWDAEENKQDNLASLFDNRVKDIEHEREMALDNDPYVNISSFYERLQEEYHKEAERLRALNPQKYKEKIQELQRLWWDAEDSKLEARWDNSQNWIDDRNTYNDWALFDDSEIQAWERVIKWLNKDYPNDLEKIKEAERNLFEARKAEFEKANDFANSHLESQKTLLQAHYDVTNAIAEARHEINKELETSKTMYEYLDEDTRKLLFNQEDYNKLCKKLNNIENETLMLQAEYEDRLNGATLETLESITSEYQMQYETLMKSYEVAKADLEIAKKKQKLNNVLNERNVRMFINGSWQWVANTQDVANAKAELADAEYARNVEKAGLAQQKSINELTKQQDALGVVVKQFENGVIQLDDAIGLAKNAIDKLPKAVSYLLSKAMGGSYSQSSSSSGSGYGSYNGVGYDKSVDYMSKILGSSNKADVIEYNNARNAKILGEQLYEKTYSDADIIKYWESNRYAEGSRYTKGGLTLMGEEGFEAYISSNGRLIPINQPTIGNIPSGGAVFNTDQMKSLRTLWDMSNLNLGCNNSLLHNSQPQQIDQRQDNRIIINGMTVDSGSSDGQALIDALRRYVGNH